MEVVALDGVKLTVLMIAGALFASVGLLFMFRAKQEGGSARLELLGQKFEASSTGIIVFLIGAAFLATPLFVPERPRQSQVPAGGKAALATDNAAAASGTGDPILPKRADGSEVEDNNFVSASNLIEVGRTISGEIEPGDTDWYAFMAAPGDKRQIRVTFRHLGNKGCSKFDVLNGDENVVGGHMTCNYEISVSRDFDVKASRYFVRVGDASERFPYEVAVAYK